MTFPAAIRSCLRGYVTFRGRASRSEYWWFVLFLMLASFAAGALDALLFGTAVVETEGPEVVAQSDGPLGTIFALAMLPPSLAAGWRRMHDTGRSGLYLLYPLIVMVGIGLFIGVLSSFEALFMGNFGAILAGGSAVIFTIALIVFFLSPLIVLWWLTRPSEPGRNIYGPNPHEVSP